MNTISISRRKFAQLLGCRRGLRRLCGEQKRQNLPRIKYWKIIADNLSRSGWSGVSAIDSNGEQAGLLTRTATMERGLSLVAMRS
jgi:hypothetical protein